MSLSRVTSSATSRHVLATSKHALAISRQASVTLVRSHSPCILRSLHSGPSPRPKPWLTRKVQSSPTAMNVFISITNALGYGNPKQIAGRRSFAIYEQICGRADEDHLFWQQACYLPPTFQSWFTITNFHIWLLTVRLRALPNPHGKAYIQGLIDHFFIDVEDRIRAVLQPRANPSEPYTFKSAFYSNPNAPPSSTSKDARTNILSRAPDRLVSQQMKIFKEQWAGMGLSFDLGLVKGDMELAAAVWRNLLGARGARGIALEPSASGTQFRRSVNLVGGEVINVAKIDIEKEETKDDGSGVFDFPPQDSEKYVAFPEVMLDLVAYMRKELVRLEGLSDDEIMNGDISILKFQRIKKQANP